MLSETHLMTLHTIAQRARRGSPHRILFAGASEEQKTNAAQRLATDLKRKLYRVDLNAIVSKYIGETEKNLQRILAGARKTSAILFLDEADALFGKRSDVKDSHDRYANLEVDYLLRQIENFGGIAILATSRKEQLNKTLLGRFNFVVDFR